MVFSLEFVDVNKIVVGTFFFVTMPMRLFSINVGLSLCGLYEFSTELIQVFNKSGHDH